MIVAAKTEPEEPIECSIDNLPTNGGSRIDWCVEATIESTPIRSLLRPASLSVNYILSFLQICMVTLF
jgi:hypothetical protein